MARRMPRVIIVGGGFGGLRAAKRLSNKQLEVILIDRKNHHTFQPLLYQVATSVLSPGEIASPIRRILRRSKNIEVLLDEVVDLNMKRQEITLSDNSHLDYDYLILAAGAKHSYFGKREWEEVAPGLKTIEDALEIRKRILFAFESAERQALLGEDVKPVRFAVIGGGPTGVELAGAIADIARKALVNDFKMIDTRNSEVMLFEGSSRILNSFSPELSEKAKQQLEELGVKVFLNSFVKEIEPGKIKLEDKIIECDVCLWATGVEASPLAKKLGVELDKAGRVIVEKDLSILGHKNIFVIGDMAAFYTSDGKQVPGVAPAAIQMADTAVENILRDLLNEPRKEFIYIDKGSMATIGRNKAIVEIGKIKLSGFIAWLAWLLVHLISLIGFRNRLRVLNDWIWAYFTRERSAILITGDAEELQKLNLQR